jgi:hypothetical protein
MLGLPSRAALAACRQAVHEVSEFHSVGFVRNLDDVRVSMLVEHPNGVSEHALPRSDIPSSLRPTVGAATQEETNWIGANPTGVAEWLLALGNVRRVASFRVPNVERPPCDTGATTSAQRGLPQGNRARHWTPCERHLT